MSEARPPAGWYPQGTEERYWDSAQWTAHTRPLSMQHATQHPAQHPAQPPYQQPYQPPPGKDNTLKVVLIVLGAIAGVGALVFGAIFLMVGSFIKTVDTTIDEAMAQTGADDRPVAVTEGEAFTRDGFSVSDGWAVESREYAGATINGLQVTLDDDQGEGGRTARFTFTLYSGKTVVGEIACSSNRMQEGENSPMRCAGSGGDETPEYDTVKVADSF